MVIPKVVPKGGAALCEACVIGNYTKIQQTFV